jgi:hypothetical protein
MVEPSPVPYPYEKQLNRLTRFLLSPQPGETKRVLVLGRHLELVITLAPSGTSYELVQAGGEDNHHVHLTPLEARSLRQVLAGGHDERFDRVEYEPNKWGAFFGIRPETKVVINDDVFVLKDESGVPFLVQGPAQRENAPFSRGSRTISLDATKLASLISVLSELEP